MADATIMAGSTCGHFPKIQKPHWVESQESHRRHWLSLLLVLEQLQDQFSQMESSKRAFRSRTTSKRNCSVNITGVFWKRHSPAS